MPKGVFSKIKLFFNPSRRSLITKLYQKINILGRIKDVKGGKKNIGKKTRRRNNKKIINKSKKIHKKRNLKTKNKNRRNKPKNRKNKTKNTPIRNKLSSSRISFIVII